MNSPADLLRGQHEFPCRFLFKVIFRPEEVSTEQLLGIVADELKDETDDDGEQADAAEIAHSVRDSANGKFQSLTIEPDVPTAEKVLAIYSRLQQTDGVVMLL